MPHRTDRRDGFAAQASFSGLNYNIRDGVNGDEVSPKALPEVCRASPRSLLAFG